MESDAFRTTAERLKEVNEVIASLDESIREAAFAVLRPYVDGHSSPDVLSDRNPGRATNDVTVDTDPSLLVDPDSLRTFLAQHHSDKPADNVKAIAAFLYSRFGTTEFTAQEVRDLAHEAGVTVPDRVDVTLGNARVSKKPLFQKIRSGVYRPTVYGEKYFKEDVGVSKGTGRRPDLES